MRLSDKIFVAGHKGMVGSALVRALQKQGYAHLLLRTRAELDLCDAAQVRAFFEEQKPDIVFLAAAKVGGIRANADYPAEFIYQNLCIQNNIIHSAYQNGVKRLLFLGSSCIYPKLAPQPLRETYLMSGALEPTNSAYAVAKIAGIEMCRSYNDQYGTSFLAAMPTNLYGVNDNYDLHNSHVLPALIRKIHEAKIQNQSSVSIWGSGGAMREFLYADDLAEACLFLMHLPDEAYRNLLTNNYYPLINIGSGMEYRIKEIACLIAQILEYSGSFVFDAAQPDGTPRKVLDTTLLQGLGWRAHTDMETGIAKTYQDFLHRFYPKL